MKEINREDLKKMLSDYGHHANVTVPVKVKVAEPDYFETDYYSVLNNGVVYNPYGKSNGKLGNNIQNAERAMKFIKDEVKIYSSVFNINEHFTVID